MMFAITGFDNWTVFAQETDPSLTTLDMELEHLGAAAVSDLFAMMGGPTSEVVPVTTKGHWWSGVRQTPSAPSGHLGPIKALPGCPVRLSLAWWLLCV